ncbi:MULTISPECIES: hypothetical protein [Nitrosomonas]|nr:MULTISPECIES: hypothetical protein [Nitrosomonas]UVS62056.1 hypothetical protein NX761_02685 [Nitrosomonas sp. PLL12]
MNYILAGIGCDGGESYHDFPLLVGLCLSLAETMKPWKAGIIIGDE